MKLWNELDVPVSPSVNEAQIAAFEVHYGVRLPPSIRDYLQTVNGLDQSTGWPHDDQMFTFWQLPLSPEDFGKENEFICPAARAWPQCRAEDAQKLYVFADYCINCCVLAICLDPEAPDYESVYWIDDEIPVLMFKFFDAYVSGYLMNRQEIFFTDSWDRTF